MKILIVSGTMLDIAAIREPANVSITSEVYAVNLARELLRRGIEVESIAMRPLTDKLAEDDPQRRKYAEYYHDMPLGRYDHAIATGQNSFEQRDPILFDRIRAATSGKVCTILDHDQGNGPEDLILHARRPSGHRQDRAAYIGWAADPAVFAPAKEPGWLTIYVDNQYMLDPARDWTQRILNQAMRFCRRYAEGKGARIAGKERARVIFHSRDGIEVIEAPEIRKYKWPSRGRNFGKRVPQAEIAAAFGRADVYMVTHTETMGLATLEAAMAGALIVAPNNFIRPELIKPLHHLTYAATPDWEDIVRNVDADRAVRHASEFTWPRLVDRLLAALDQPARDNDAGTPPPRELAGSLAAVREWAMIGSKRITPLFSKKDDLIVRAKRMPGLHEIRRRIAKRPWPILYTARFTLAGDGCDEARLLMASTLDIGSRAEARFDLARGRVRLAVGRGEWQIIGATITPAGDRGWQCTMQALSDYMPEIDFSIGLMIDGQAKFRPAGRMEISIEDPMLVEGMV